eukprot:6865743-Pyramimonas_sp.AAC.1
MFAISLVGVTGELLQPSLTHLPDQRVQARGQRVFDGDGVPLLVRPHHVAHVGGDGQRQAVHRLPLRQPVEDRGAHGVVQLHGPVLRQPARSTVNGQQWCA